jgi:hypothetical protein
MNLIFDCIATYPMFFILWTIATCTAGIVLRSGLRIRIRRYIFSQ